MIVRLENNKVIEIITEEATKPDVKTWYGEEFAAQCVEAPDEVLQNWVYDPDTKTFSEPIPAVVIYTSTIEERVVALESAMLASLGV